MKLKLIVTVYSSIGKNKVNICICQNDAVWAYIGRNCLPQILVRRCYEKKRKRFNLQNVLYSVCSKFKDFLTVNFFNKSMNKMYPLYEENCKCVFKDLLKEFNFRQR